LLHQMDGVGAGRAVQDRVERLRQMYFREPHSPN
jgi:hypothetical protein